MPKHIVTVDITHLPVTRHIRSHRIPSVRRGESLPGGARASRLIWSSVAGASANVCRTSANGSPVWWLRRLPASRRACHNGTGSIGDARRPGRPSRVKVRRSPTDRESGTGCETPQAGRRQRPHRLSAVTVFDHKLTDTSIHLVRNLRLAKRVRRWTTGDIATRAPPTVPAEAPSLNREQCCPSKELGPEDALNAADDH